MSARADFLALLKEARGKVVIPSRLIRVADGQPFEPSEPITMQFGGPSDDIRPGDFAGYESLLTPAYGNWSAPPAPWRVSRMVWAGNPAYQEAVDYQKRLDSAIASIESSRKNQSPGKCPSCAANLPWGWWLEKPAEKRGGAK